MSNRSLAQLRSALRMAFVVRDISMSKAADEMGLAKSTLSKFLNEKGRSALASTVDSIEEWLNPPAADAIAPTLPELLQMRAETSERWAQLDRAIGEKTSANPPAANLDVLAHVPGPDGAASRAVHVVLIEVRPGHNRRRHPAGSINDPYKLAVRLSDLPIGTTHIILEMK